MPENWYAARVNPVPMPLRFTPTLEQDTLPAPYRYATQHLLAQGFGVYCPYFAREAICRGERVRIASALFPGYLFVSFNPVTKAWRSINETRGVKHLLPMHEEIPIAVPAAFIDRIRENETLLAAVKTVQLFAANQIVRILAGPMENQVGTVVESRREFTRLRLRIFGGRDVPAVVSTSDLIAELAEKGQP